jgi:hypothetical protein
MYDTLLQMGRWFGYRPGYADLPRIWMPAEMRRWFSHLASVEAEMRREIERYLSEHKTPLDMSVRIRCHPRMRVTAPSRMGSQIRAAAGYGGQLIETRYFKCSPAQNETAEDVVVWHRRNRDAVERLLVTAAADGRPDTSAPASTALYRGVPTGAVLEFVQGYRFDARSTEYSPALVRHYLERRMAKGGLQNWNIGVVGKAIDAGRPVALPDGQRVGAVTRTRTKGSENDPVADIKTLTGSRDPGLDLTLPPPGGAGGDETVVNRANLNRWRVQQQPDVGLLLLYPIDGRSSAPAARKDRRDLAAPESVDIIWGTALIFPEPVSGADVTVEYDYVQADLSQVFPAAAEGVDDEDGFILDQDLDRAGDGVPTP